MRQRFSLNEDTMALTIVLWLCSLPLIGLVVLPLFGQAVAAATAVVLLLIMLPICWGICSWRVVKERSR
jgi:hypothetical protein